jgi:DNA-binding Xre family transcriptional regulator
MNLDNSSLMRKYIYQEFIRMEDLYNNTPMEYIKENLYQIKIKLKEKYKADCKRNNKNVGKFHILSNIGISENLEHAYTNKTHPSKIPFNVLIRICDALDVNFDDIIKESKEREKTREGNKSKLKWTEQVIKEYLNLCETHTVDEIAKRYDISPGVVLKYKNCFLQGLNVNGKIRNP